MPGRPSESRESRAVILEPLSVNGAALVGGLPSCGGGRVLLTELSVGAFIGSGRQLHWIAFF